MPHVVAEPCIKCRFSHCVEACPVDCFHIGANMMVIDPDECIDCRKCLKPCPVNAIFPQEELPTKWAHYKKLNREYAGKWPNIVHAIEPLPTAQEYEGQRDKPGLFDPASGWEDK